MGEYINIIFSFSHNLTMTYVVDKEIINYSKHMIIINNIVTLLSDFLMYQL